MAEPEELAFKDPGKRRNIAMPSVLEHWFPRLKEFLARATVRRA